MGQLKMSWTVLPPRTTRTPTSHHPTLTLKGTAHAPFTCRASLCTSLNCLHAILAVPRGHLSQTRQLQFVELTGKRVPTTLIGFD